VVAVIVVLISGTPTPAELCVNLGDDGLREAAYRGG
jgi:hypothetical protein